MGFSFKTLNIHHFLLLLLILCVLSFGFKVEAKGQTFGFVRTKGPHFVLKGSPFLFNGFNSYWLMHVAVDPNDRYKVSEVFREASAAGLTVCRTWAFSDGGDRALQVSPGTYDERVFQALDFVVSEARRYGIKLIMTFVNNWNDFGGKAQYVQWARNSGAYVSNDDDFYTHPLLKKYYKDHINRVVTRFNTLTRIAYRDDPTIMAWELMNEPRCQVDYTGRTINGWVQEVASYVKSLDRKHLLDIGMEGFYGDAIPQKKENNPGYQVGTDFITNNLIQDVDFATIHAYPDQWVSGEVHDNTNELAFMQKWMTSHWEDSRTILKKPLVLTEFGKSNKDPGFNLNERDQYMSTVYRTIYGFARSGATMSGSLVWQLLAPGMEAFNDGYGVVLSQMPSTANVMYRQAQAMSALSHIVTQQQRQEQGQHDADYINEGARGRHSHRQPRKHHHHQKRNQHP